MCVRLCVCVSLRVCIYARKNEFPLLGTSRTHILTASYKFEKHTSLNCIWLNLACVLSILNNDSFLHNKITKIMNKSEKRKQESVHVCHDNAFHVWLWVVHGKRNLGGRCFKKSIIKGKEILIAIFTKIATVASLKRLTIFSAVEFSGSLKSHSLSQNSVSHKITDGSLAENSLVSEKKRGMNVAIKNIKCIVFHHWPYNVALLIISKNEKKKQ